MTRTCRSRLLSLEACVALLLAPPAAAGAGPGLAGAHGTAVEREKGRLVASQGVIWLFRCYMDPSNNLPYARGELSLQVRIGQVSPWLSALHR